MHKTQAMTKRWGSETAAAQVGQAGIVSAEQQHKRKKIRQPSGGGGEKNPKQIKNKNNNYPASFVESQDQRVGLEVTVACDTEDKLNLPESPVNTECCFETIHCCFGVSTVHGPGCTNRIFHLPWLNWNIWDSGYKSATEKNSAILTLKDHFVKPYKITCWCRLNCIFFNKCVLSIFLFYREFTRLKKINKYTR